MSLRKSGANTGATTAFLISTPESGVDSISITYALLDPIMTVARPVVAFITASLAGITENLFAFTPGPQRLLNLPARPADERGDEKGLPAEGHRPRRPFFGKIGAGLGYAFGDLWGDIAGWFFLGLLLAGAITALVPDDLFARYLGAGLPAMLLMLAVGIPLYICASSSTPIAAALILKGVSPGAALVFLLAGPATNMASLTVLFGTLGRRATVIYLTSIAVCSVLFGLLVDQIYIHWGISAQAMAGQASEVLPAWLQWAGAAVVLLLSAKSLYQLAAARFRKPAAPVQAVPEPAVAGAAILPPATDCGPT